MKRVYMVPQLDHSETTDRSNTIHQIVVHLARHLPEYGYEVVSNGPADLVVSHAGMGQEGELPPDVAVCHGLYPTGEKTHPVNTWHWGANKNVITDLRSARQVTVPSNWVGEIIRRDMHLVPTVIPWAIEPEEWSPESNSGYVLWAKTRADGVCDPKPLVELAMRAPQVSFLTTFGEGLPNIRTVGRQEFSVMRDMIRHAGIYLSTTKETFGITTLEAMASGVPVLGYNWGGTSDIVQHGITGYLVEPGDLDGMRVGLEYCLRHRAVLGANARSVAQQYTWNRVAEQFAGVFNKITSVKENPVKVTVVIPCHNYAQYVGDAINSVKAQETTFTVEIIVIADRCTDNSVEIIGQALGNREDCQWYFGNHGNPADARNDGIERARGEYIVCLDADDRLGDVRFLSTLAGELDGDRSLGIVFTGLRIMNTAGELSTATDWPKGYDYDRQCERHNQVPTCCMFRRDAWERAGGYRRRYVPAEDAELWLRIGAVGFRGKHVTTDPWFVYRMHGDSLSTPVRTGEVKEPDWISDKPWTTDGLRPFAADGKPPSWSWPVRNYDRPKVSIVIPCTEAHRQYLPEALDSVEAQTERHWECTVVNDSNRPLDLPSYPWVRVIDTGGQKGPGYSRNAGWKAARAALVTFLDADDIFSQRFLALTLRMYAKTGRYVYTDWYSLNKEGLTELHETPDYDPNEVFRRTSLHSINVLVPKVVLESVEGFDEVMACWEDVDLFMKFAAAGHCGARVPEPLVLYRYTTGNLREHGETIKEDLKGLLRDRYVEYIKSEKMCGCASTPKPALPTLDGAVAGTNGTGELVRIEYSGPSGPHAVVGAETKQNYGRRANGDVFYVHAEDQSAQPARFVSIVEVGTVIQPTLVPGEPVLV